MSGLTVSVVIATYNRGERIARTLDSVLAQTTHPSEIIVVDDGSTDSTAAWIRAHYPQVAVRTFPNGGSSVARNRGAQQATGDLLVFLDHDDEMLPRAIETLVGLLMRFPEARGAFADHEYKDVIDNEYHPNHHSDIGAFRRLRQIATLDVHGDARTYGREMYYALLRGNLLQQPWAVYRPDFLAIEGYDPGIRYCEDWELYIRLTKERVIALTDQVISIHFVEGQNLHRAAGQDLQHMKVLHKHLRLNGLKDRRAVGILRERLGNYYKTIGDRRRAAKLPGAWWAYLRSFWIWPFDLVVAFRCLAWGPEGLRDAVAGSLRGKSVSSADPRG
jgi:glycosyltransferase involved in cell wall biosynthesis